MPNHKDTYNRDAVRYDRLVSREDYQGNILRTIESISPLSGKEVADLGAGTGRLTCLLAPFAGAIQAFDASQHMLDLAIRKLSKSGLKNWQVGVGDHRSLPAGDDCADIVISGWSVCYLVDRNGSDWKAEVEKALAEMRRILRPGGLIILLETMGTGFETPHPPDHLVDYYHLLKEKGFESQWIRTDYQFNSIAEGVELVQFFFGDELASQMQSANSLILPECTGVWWQVIE
jgi:ubiquinone/menaquinone biosynthesis C-methylase UbiE